MPNAYDIKFRMKAIKLYEKTKSREYVAEVFSIGVATIARWFAKYNNGKSLIPKKQAPKQSSKINREKLKKYVCKNNNKSLREIGKVFNVTDVCILYNLRKLGFTFKKNSYYIGKEMNKDDKSTEKK